MLAKGVLGSHWLLLFMEVTVFGAGFENNLSVGQVAKKIHLCWCCPKLSQIFKKSQHLDNYRLAV